MWRGRQKRLSQAVLHVNCNAAYTLEDLQLFKGLDELDLAMIEQPLHHDDLLDHATLQAPSGTAVCLDESITSVARARQALDIGSCRWINVKPGRMGGLTPARGGARLAERAGVPCWIGGMLESGLAPRIASRSQPVLTSGIPRTFSRRAASMRPIWPGRASGLSGGTRVTALAGPGIGCEPDPGRLRSVTLEQCRLSAATVWRRRWCREAGSGRRWTTPVDSPFYPRRPLFIATCGSSWSFPGEPRCNREYLPNPLVASEHGLCVAAGMDVPFCTSYGAFRETFLLLACSFDMRAGYTARTYSTTVLPALPRGARSTAPQNCSPPCRCASEAAHSRASAPRRGDRHLGQLDDRARHLPRTQSPTHAVLAVETDLPGRRSGLDVKQLVDGGPRCRTSRSTSVLRAAVR